MSIVRAGELHCVSYRLKHKGITEGIALCWRTTYTTCRGCWILADVDLFRSAVVKRVERDTADGDGLSG
jgi:hypothetical protein